MALPDGSMVLICPVGPEYSQVSDTDFDVWNSSAFYHVEEIIDPAIFAVWFSNAKRVTTTYTDSDSPSSNYTSNGIQWAVDVFGNPVTPNSGDHPFPKTQSLDGGAGLETPEDLPDAFTYANEEWPTDGHLTDLPLFFIHKDRFYCVQPLQVGSDASTTSFSLTASSINVTQTFDLGAGSITISYTITIDQLFYP